jgi:hypothetical protein
MSLTLAAGGPGGAPSDELRTHLASRMAEERMPALALAYVDRQGRSVSFALGEAQSGQVATAQTRFLLGSLTKGFLGALLEAVRGRLFETFLEHEVPAPPRYGPQRGEPRPCRGSPRPGAELSSASWCPSRRPSTRERHPQAES